MKEEGGQKKKKIDATQPPTFLSSLLLFLKENKNLGSFGKRLGGEGGGVGKPVGGRRKFELVRWRKLQKLAAPSEPALSFVLRFKFG